MKQTTRTKSHYRNGKRVKSYTQQRSAHAEAWRDAARKGAFAGAAGVGTVFLVLELGFTLISTLAIVATAILTAVAGRRTYHALTPNRTRSRPPARTRRSAPGSTARRRTNARKAKWRARRRKTGKWARRKGNHWAMAGARAAGRAWRRANGRPQGWNPAQRRRP
jgi:hypothetical protein